MTWEHFTDWLTSDEQSITRLQAQELVAALRERVQATGMLMPEDILYDRHPFNRLVVPPEELSTSPRPINWVISNISTRYMRNASGIGVGLDKIWDGETIWRAAHANIPAAIRPPLSLLDALEMRSPTPPLHYTRDFWNLCRSAIQLLQWPVFHFFPQEYSRYVGDQENPIWPPPRPGYDWESAFADWLNAPELAGGRDRIEINVKNWPSLADHGWEIWGSRWKMGLDFPEIPYGNGPWNAWTRMATGPKNIDEFVPATLRVKIGGQERDEPITHSSSEDYRRFDLGKNWSVTGPLTVGLRVLPYPSTDRSDYDPWFPFGAFANDRVRLRTWVDIERLPATGYFLATTPQFTHP